MSTSATNSLARHMRKTALWCLGLAGLCVLADNVYALFGHGVRSPYMTWMCLYPLLGGTVLFEVLSLFVRRADAGAYRAGYNVYFSGIATLTVASFFVGILKIAGATSAYAPVFFAVGGVLAAAGLALLARAFLLGKSS